MVNQKAHPCNQVDLGSNVFDSCISLDQCYPCTCSIANNGILGYSHVKYLANVVKILLML